MQGRIIRRIQSESLQHPLLAFHKIRANGIRHYNIMIASYLVVICNLPAAQGSYAPGKAATTQIADISSPLCLIHKRFNWKICNQAFAGIQCVQSA